MNILRICSFALVFLNLFLSVQAQTATTRIIKSSLSDTSFLNLELRDADYDLAKNRFPYYRISKETAYNQTAKATLIEKRSRVVDEPHASAIKKYFSDFLTNKYELVEVTSLSKNKNYNHHKLSPFRLNGQGQVEELIDYDISWQIVGNTNLSARGAAAGAFKNNSVLATGKWYKIGVTQSGIHKITKSFLSNAGINTTGLDPRKIRIYGNGGKMLPEVNKAFRYDDLEENAIKVIGEEDGVFDNSDYILFYATGPTEWIKTNAKTGLSYRALKNRFSDTSFYFINVDLGNGKRTVNRPSLSQTPNSTTNTYDYYNFHEEDLVNFGKSGIDFYGEFFDVTDTYKFTWNDGDFVVGDSLTAEVIVAATHRDTTNFLLTGNGLSFITITAKITPDTYAPYAAARSKFASTLNPNSSEIGITISKTTPKSIGWLDKLTVNARRKIVVNTKQFLFRDKRVMGPGKVCNFVVDNPASHVVTIWNVTDPINPVIQEYSANGTQLNFNARVDSMMEFCAAPSTDFYSPVFVGRIVNQNLHSLQQADYVIVTHPLFIKEAERLGAFHQQHDNLSYAIATTEQIYNEFSSGRQDISAIRDFVRMLYSRNIAQGKEVKYLLLMGDGSYNNRSRNLINNSNFVPTYQSHISLSSTSSIATDDFYGLMDPDEGYYAEDNGDIDIGIGRFTCRTVNEVKAVIAKIENYYRKDAAFSVNKVNTETCNTLSESPMGDWRNWLLFLGDDEDGAEHMDQSSKLSEIITPITTNYNYDKILLDAYQRFSTPGGPRYPDASEDFLKRMKKGALIFNYTGHGGEVGLTAERMIDIDIINNLDNFNKLPLFITATCEFTRYDDPGRTSAGELCLLNPKGGAIALMTTCRLAYSKPNFELNKILLNRLFRLEADGTRPKLGDAIRETKAHFRQSSLYANFHLIGDPALTLAYPEYKVLTSKINNVAVTPTGKDTLSALSKVTVEGFVADTAGNKLSNFNGVVYPTVFDKEQMVSCLMNSPSSATNYGDPSEPPLQPFQFKLQKNMIYRGKAEVTNGNFSFTFMVPKDISFSIGPGKISYYATNGLIDATGAYNQISVGGDPKNVVVDNDGPQVDLFFNDKTFVNGGITNEKPVLYADLVDSSGINTLGSGIGHDISVILDENGSKPLILNDYYEANLNSYQSGRVRYPYKDLSEGTHRLSFKVWDIQNNSNTVYTDFIVAKSAELALKQVLNYPNPFTTRTKFMFQHNQACNPLKVTIQVYTVSGKIVKTIQRSVTCEGFTPEGIDWDGRDDFGDKLARGVYVYKLAILDVDNKKAEKIEKLVILN